MTAPRPAARPSWARCGSTSTSSICSSCCCSCSATAAKLKHSRTADAPAKSRGVLLLCAAMQLRPATLADIPAITAIYDHAVRHGTASFELEPPTQAEMTRRMQAVLDGKFPYLAAEIDGKLAGYAYASLYRTRPAYR